MLSLKGLIYYLLFLSFFFFLLAPSVVECVEAGNTLLGFSVQKDALGLWAVTFIALFLCSPAKDTVLISDLQYKKAYYLKGQPSQP